MRWTIEYREQIKEKVRSIIIRKPRASQYELAKILGIDKDVALRLKKQVIAENTKNVSEQEVKKEIGKLEAEYEQLALECWQIITQDVKTIKVKTRNKETGQPEEIEVDTIITPREKLNAIKTIVDTRKNLFNIKFDAGVFKRKIGEIEIGKTLNEEEQALIKKAIELDYGKPIPDPATSDDSDTEEDPDGNREKTTGGQDK